MSGLAYLVPAASSTEYMVVIPFTHCPYRRTSVQERYDSLTNSIKEQSVVEASVIPPATGKKVSIPDVFNSPQTTPTTSPTHRATPTNGVVERVRESPVPSPRNRRKLQEGSPVPSPKTGRRPWGRKESSGDEIPPKPQLPPRIRATGNGQANQSAN